MRRASCFQFLGGLTWLSERKTPRVPIHIEGCWSLVLVSVDLLLWCLGDDGFLW